MKAASQVTWSAEYIERRARRQGFRAATWKATQRKRFEAETGVKWSYWQQQRRIVFHPDWRNLRAKEDKELARRILKVLHGYNYYVGWVTLWREIPDVTLKELLTTARWMVDTTQALVTVGRTGYAGAIRRVPGRRVR